MSLFSVFRRSPAPAEPADKQREASALPAAASAQSVLMTPPVTAPAALSYKSLSAEQIKERLVALVRIPSTITNERAAVDWFHEQFKSLQARCPTVAERITIDYWEQAVDQLSLSPAKSSSSSLSADASSSSGEATTDATETTTHTDDQTDEQADNRTPVRQEIANATLACVAIRLHGSAAGAHVLLSGHVDVAPPGNPSMWNHAAFSGHEEDGFVFGRGCADMKAGLVAALEVVQLFAASGGDFAGALTLLVTSGDLDGALGTLSAVQRNYRPDYVILPKPTGSGLSVDPAVVVAHAGALFCSIGIDGRSANSCKRMEGESAFAHLLSIYGRLNQAERHINERETNPLMRELVLPYPTCLGRIAGGDWSGSVMDRVDAHVRFGVMLGESLHDAQTRIANTIAEASHDVPWLARHPPTLTLLGGAFESSSLPVDHPLVEALSRAGLRVFGRRVRHAGASYGSAMAVWNNVARVPCVLYGPGDVRLSQAPNENVEIRSVHLVAQVLLEAVAALLKSPLQRADQPSYEEQLVQQNDSLQKEIFVLQERKRLQQLQLQQQQHQQEAPPETDQPPADAASSAPVPQPDTDSVDDQPQQDTESPPVQQTTRSWSIWADWLKL